MTDPTSKIPIPIELTAAGWDDRYQSGTDRWDLGCPAPPFVNLLASPQAPKPGRVAVLGCGAGHDALCFAAAGFEVVGFDFAPSAIERAAQAAAARGLSVRFLQRDIFALEPEFLGGFDYVVEHTCFCAIDPGLRSDYVQVVRRLLRPGGLLIGLFFTHDRVGGPPFGVRPEEVLRYFEVGFEGVSFGAAGDSIESRQGEEYLGLFRKC